MTTDSSLILGVQQPNTMQMISNMLGMQSQINKQKLQTQALQSGAMSNQQAGIDQQEIQNAQEVMKNAPRDADGNIDMGALSPIMAQAAPKNYAKFMDNLANAQNSANVAKQSWLGAQQKQRDAIGSIAGSLIGDKDPKVAVDTFNQIASSPAYANMGPSLDHFQAALKDAAATGDPAAVDGILNRIRLQAAPATSQQAMQTPEGIAVNDGQVSSVISTKPGTTVPPGTPIPGTTVQQQLAPSTPTVAANGQPGYLGPQPSPNFPTSPFDASGVQGPNRAKILQDIASNNPDPSVRAQAKQAMVGGLPVGQGSGFVPSGLPPGAMEGITGPVAVANQHFAQVQADASAAPNRIAALQTIKQQIPSAIMGGGGAGDFLRGLSRTFGFASDAATANDVMAKNLAVIAAQGGNTDAARTLGEMGNPSYHMTADAAQRAVDQLTGIEAKKQAAASFFSGTPTNTATYANKMTMWNQYGDPRAFEYASKSPQDRATMRAEMQKAGTWETLKSNMAHLDAMGVEPQ